jgi:hypothetical protein
LAIIKASYRRCVWTCLFLWAAAPYHRKRNRRNSCEVTPVGAVRTGSGLHFSGADSTPGCGQSAGARLSRQLALDPGAPRVGLPEGDCRG